MALILTLLFLPYYSYPIPNSPGAWTWPSLIGEFCDPALWQGKLLVILQLLSCLCAVGNVCSSRMTPVPHPHTPGNMWAARCGRLAWAFVGGFQKWGNSRFRGTPILGKLHLTGGILIQAMAWEDCDFGPNMGTWAKISIKNSTSTLRRVAG